MNKQKTIAFDLDDVICFRKSQYEHLGPEKYDYCEPYPEVIEIINSLYDENNKIIIFTARGMSQFKGNVEEIYKNLFEKTNNQLKKWNVKYHELVMGKIHYDLLIDDKALNSEGITKEKIDLILS
jgi:histidinol phosphatase-like enzyme